MDTSNVQELLVSQGKNVLTSMQNLKYHANKKGKERASLYENYVANEHSFRVYTYIDSTIGQSTEVQLFLKKLELFNANFHGVHTELDRNVDGKKVNDHVKEALEAYDHMVHAFEQLT